MTSESVPSLKVAITEVYTCKRVWHLQTLYLENFQIPKFRVHHGVNFSPQLMQSCTEMDLREVSEAQSLVV